MSDHVTEMDRRAFAAAARIFQLASAICRPEQCELCGSDAEPGCPPLCEQCLALPPDAGLVARLNRGAWKVSCEHLTQPPAAGQAGPP